MDFKKKVVILVEKLKPNPYTLVANEEYFRLLRYPMSNSKAYFLKQYEHCKYFLTFSKWLELVKLYEQYLNEYGLIHRCKYCGVSFEIQYNLYKHMIKNHKKKDLKTCRKCCKIFIYPKGYLIHKTTMKTKINHFKILSFIRIIKNSNVLNFSQWLNLNAFFNTIQ